MEPWAWKNNRQSSIIDTLLSRLDIAGCEIKTISLVCGSDVLVNRLNKDIAAGLRQPDVLERSLERLPMYEQLHTTKIDVSEWTPEEVADAIAAL